MVDSRGRIRKTEKFRTDFAKNNAWRISREDGRTRIRLTDQVFITQQDIRDLADILQAVLDTGSLCVVGNEEQVKAESAMFGKVESLFR